MLRGSVPIKILRIKFCLSSVYLPVGGAGSILTEKENTFIYPRHPKARQGRTALHKQTVPKFSNSSLQNLDSRKLNMSSE